MQQKRTEPQDQNAWALCDDSLVVDLMETEPRLVIDAMRASAKRSILPHWNSSDSATGASQWHYNHSPSIGPLRGRTLAPSPRTGQPRYSATHIVKQHGYRDWRSVWQCAKRLLHVPNGCELLRIYQNVYPYGADGCVHTDSDAPDEVTMCLFLHPAWDTDWGGETVLLDPNGEVHRAVLPKPGRLFAFRSAVPHAARPVARAAVPPRTVLVLKMGPWPARHPVAMAAPDAVTSLRDLPTIANAPRDWTTIDASTRRALATQWVLASRAQRVRHGDTSLAAHLVSTAAWLAAWNTSESTVLGGLAHALCGTQHFRRRCFDSVRDRPQLEDIFTAEGIAIALAFASCDRGELATLSRTPPEGEEPITLRRDPRGPEGRAEFGALEVSRDTLAALLYIQAANELSVTGIDNCIEFDRARIASD